MLNLKLEDFITENVSRTASAEQIQNIVRALAEIVKLKPAELGHFLYIFASAERAHKMRTSPYEHFKRLHMMLKRVKFALECELCF